MNMPVIEDKTRARRGDPSTSKDAAGRVREFDTGQYAKILQCLQIHPNMGAEEIARYLGSTAYAMRKRLPELEAAGLVAVVYDSEGMRAITRKTSTGRQERTWKILPDAARQALPPAGAGRS